MKLVLFGISELSRVLTEYFEEQGSKVSAYVIDEDYKNSETFNDRPVYTTDFFLNNFSKNDYKIFICIGSQKNNKPREEKYLFFKEKGYKFESFIHKDVSIASNVKFGEHLLILEKNNIQHFCEIEDNVFIWSCNHIGHSTKLEKNVFVSSNITISGCVLIKKNTFIGVGCTIANNLCIGKNNFLSNGCHMTVNTKDNEIYKSEKPKLLNAKTNKLIK